MSTAENEIRKRRGNVLCGIQRLRCVVCRNTVPLLGNIVLLMQERNRSTFARLWVYRQRLGEIERNAWHSPSSCFSLALSLASDECWPPTRWVLSSPVGVVTPVCHTLDAEGVPPSSVLLWSHCSGRFPTNNDVSVMLSLVHRQ